MMPQHGLGWGLVLSILPLNGKTYEEIIMNQWLSTISKKYKQSRLFRISHIITTSATFALFLSIAFFVFETWDNKRDTHDVINNLMQIQNSLSTRYLGLFPEYITVIDSLLAEGINPHVQTPNHKVDTVIIFEDVLYYGVKSRPRGFCKMNELVYQLAQNGCQIYIAYYKVNGKAYQQMIRESLVEASLLTNLEQDRYRLFMDTTLTIACKREKDSILCEKYYQLSRSQNERAHDRGIREYLRTIPIQKQAKEGTALFYVNNLAQKMDSIKKNTIGKTKPKDVTYAEYKQMYIGFTHQMEAFYSQCGENVHLIPLDDYQTMSCWMISGGGNGKAIFAFPSKYATDEIGFISQDKAIANYIRTMLKGVLVTIK